MRTREISAARNTRYRTISVTRRSRASRIGVPKLELGTRFKKRDFNRGHPAVFSQSQGRAWRRGSNATFALAHLKAKDHFTILV